MDDQSRAFERMLQRSSDTDTPVFLPAGAYVVLVTWYPPNARELENPKNKLPDVYSRQADSPLRATVKAGPNELEPFRLTK